MSFFSKSIFVVSFMVFNCFSETIEPQFSDKQKQKIRKSLYTVLDLSNKLKRKKSKGNGLERFYQAIQSQNKDEVVEEQDSIEERSFKNRTEHWEMLLK